MYMCVSLALLRSGGFWLWFLHSCSKVEEDSTSIGKKRADVRQVTRVALCSCLSSSNYTIRYFISQRARYEQSFSEIFKRDLPLITAK